MLPQRPDHRDRGRDPRRTSRRSNSTGRQRPHGTSAPWCIASCSAWPAAVRSRCPAPTNSSRCRHASSTRTGGTRRAAGSTTDGRRARAGSGAAHPAPIRGAAGCSARSIAMRISELALTGRARAGHRQRRYRPHVCRRRQACAGSSITRPARTKAPASRNSWTSERERYAPQLERYATLMRPLGDEPMRVGLYFPLLSAWREWAPGEVGAQSVPPTLNWRRPEASAGPSICSERSSAGGTGPRGASMPSSRNAAITTHVNCASTENGPSLSATCAVIAVGSSAAPVVTEACGRGCGNTA